MRHLSAKTPITFYAIALSGLLLVLALGGASARSSGSTADAASSNREVILELRQINRQLKTLNQTIGNKYDSSFDDTVNGHLKAVMDSTKASCRAAGGVVC